MIWDDVANKYGCDKASGYHGYMGVYQLYLEGRKVERLLELGVAHGKSLAMWHELFPAALIVGVDNVPECRLHQRVNIDVVIADIRDPAKMAAVSQLYGPFDVIIDDCVHDPEPVGIAFEELYPRLSPGGVYIIEDLEFEDEGVKKFASIWGAEMVPCTNKGLIIKEKF